jgi:UDP-glucuronate 4-epimerase
MAKILITGAAGFIGFHLVKRLQNQHELLLIDALFDLNKASLERANLIDMPIHKIDLAIDEIKLDSTPDLVIHLAAETGISASEANPELYVRQNILATSRLLSYCKNNGVKQVIYASSSSIYPPVEGPMSEDMPLGLPKSFYGFSKMQMEKLVSAYCERYQLKAIGLRFFTVYGPWTRPDMAAYKFMSAIRSQTPIQLYGNGDVYRDFTYVGDICNAIERLIPVIETTRETHSIFNIGSGRPVSVDAFITAIFRAYGQTTKINRAELPRNELQVTFCDQRNLQNTIGEAAPTSLEEGISDMVHWFKNNTYD